MLITDGCFCDPMLFLADDVLFALMETEQQLVGMKIDVVIDDDDATRASE